MSQPDVKVLNFTTSYEGEDLLSDSILRDLPHFKKEDLITGGFELIFKVK